MSATVQTPTVSLQRKAEVLPLSDSHPESPAKIGQVTATSPADIVEPNQLQSAAVQVLKTDNSATAVINGEDTKSNSDPTIGTNKSAACSDGKRHEIEQVSAGKSEPAIDSKYATDTDSSQSSQDVSDVKPIGPDAEPEADVNDAAEKEDAAIENNDQSFDSTDAKLMDPNDTENKGNIAKTFFTNEVQAQLRCLSPIHEHRIINLKFSEMADLFVKTTDADGRAYIFQVHSATLEAASMVLHDMMYKTNPRGNKEAWVWELEDSAIGLKVMFSLLHLNYRAALFTQEPASHQVYEVLRVLAKFNIRDEAFHPFVKSWVAGFRKGLDDSLLTHLERLYTAHRLGDFKTLKVAIRKVAHEIEVTTHGSVLIGDKPIQEVVPITDELVANLRAVRSTDLKDILDPLKTAYDTLMGDTDDQDATDFCKSLDGHDECNEKLLGSLLGNLRRQKLRPVPSPVAYTGSVGVLAEKVSQMDIRGLIVPNLEPHKQRHGRCKLGQDHVARQLLNGKAYLPIYDDLVDEMVITTKRTGTYKDEKAEFEDYKDAFNKASIKYDEEFCRDFWGWDENPDSTGSERLFPTDVSGTGEESDFKERKISSDLASPAISDA